VFALINSTHAGEDFFEPLTIDSLSARLSRDRSYGPDNLFGVTARGRLAAVAGLWDKGATTERIEVDLATGLATGSRGTVVVDWGWAPGHDRTFAALLRTLAAASRKLGRQTMTICGLRLGAIPDIGLGNHQIALSLYTPTIDPPAEADISEVFADLLTI